MFGNLREIYLANIHKCDIMSKNHKHYLWEEKQEVPSSEEMSRGKT